MVSVMGVVFGHLKLANAASDKKQHGDSSKPPGKGHACGEARYYEEDAADGIENDV